MPVVYSAIVPHPPVLIPEIGKDNLKKLAKTIEAIVQVEQELYAAKPECLVIISPHGKVLPDAFNINLSADYTAHFKEFGEFSIELKFKSDYMSIQEIRAADESNQEAPIVLTSDQELDYGFAVPLYSLTKHLKQIPIIPITYAGLDYESHFKFGQFLYREFARSNKRFAVIASADLSHKLTKDAPAGYSPNAKEFDKTFVGHLRKKDISAILKINPKEVKGAEVCGVRSILILLGIIESLNVKPEVLSYEGPFGVGYATCTFRPA